MERTKERLCNKKKQRIEEIHSTKIATKGSATNKRKQKQKKLFFLYVALRVVSSALNLLIT